MFANYNRGQKFSERSIVRSKDTRSTQFQFVQQSAGQEFSFQIPHPLSPNSMLVFFCEPQAELCQHWYLDRSGNINHYCSQQSSGGYFHLIMSSSLIITPIRIA